MSQAEYEQNEARLLAVQIGRVESAPLADRREARDDMRAAMLDPALIRERCEWLLEGCYGFGACQQTARIQQQARGNREAALLQLLAPLEWLCSADDCRKAWKSLKPAEQKSANEAVRAALATPAAV